MKLGFYSYLLRRQRLTGVSSPGPEMSSRQNISWAKSSYFHVFLLVHSTLSNSQSHTDLSASLMSHTGTLYFELSLKMTFIQYDRDGSLSWQIPFFFLCKGCSQNQDQSLQRPRVLTGFVVGFFLSFQRNPSSSSLVLM